MILGPMTMPHSLTLETKCVTPFPKGDIRRTLSVIGAIDGSNGVTVMEISKRTGLDNRSISHILNKAIKEASVVIEKIDSKYHLKDIGPVFNRNGLIH